MTADAITGVEEKCKQVGITDYVSKPFEPDELISILIGLIQPLESIPILDISYGIRVLGNNVEVYKHILQEYTKENEDTLQNLQIRLEEENYDEAIQIVHKIKGSTGNIGAKKLYKLTSELQIALTHRNESDVRNLQHAFEKTLKRLFKEIHDYLQGHH